jgi:hypothetical protein
MCVTLSYEKFERLSVHRRSPLPRTDGGNSVSVPQSVPVVI